MNFVFLAAGKSSRIYKNINKPKCMISVNKEKLIESLIKKIVISNRATFYCPQCQKN